MLRPRIIPSLLIQNNGLVKTENFKNPIYIGDPINAVKIFSEKKADELVIFDIDATVLNNEPNYSLIRKLACQSRMPLCYGGGIKTVEQAQKIISLGVEKIALSAAAVENPQLISEISRRIGSQSVIIVLDVKKKINGEYKIVTHNAKKSSNFDPIEFAVKAQNLGAGEIILNNVDLDGSMKGFDIDLIHKIKEKINIPLTVLGGAGSLDDIYKVIKTHGIIGVAAGSLFVFKGRYKAVLINYPNRIEKENLF